VHFQDRTVNLWEAFATRYRDNPWVAGYNPINEPYDPGEALIMPVYRRLVDAIRAIDPHHLIFLEGNRYSQDFHMFGDPWPGIVYTNHDYADPGFMEGGPYPGVTNGRYYDNEVLEEVFLQRSEYMLKHNLHIWVGEFGPVYTGDPALDAMRYRLLHDQLEIYRHHKASWSIWLYKDVGLQALTYAAPDSPWMQRVGAFVQKKARLGVDAWGGREDGVRDIMVPLRETLHREAPGWNPGPFGADWYAKRHVSHLLLSEAILPEFAALFEGLSEPEIDELMQSFRFRNCVIRQELSDLLSAYAG
jgi:hypothetical protein